jgi:hypothetical protein
MKTRTSVLIVILVLAVLIVADSCATGKKSYVTKDDVFNELSGTWYNEEYEKPTKDAMPKVIVHSDGSFDEYKEFAETTAPRHNTGQSVSIKEAWTDSKGNTWYQARFIISWANQELFETGKVSDSGNVWESVYSSVDYPAGVNSEHFNYEIHYRQE